MTSPTTSTTLAVASAATATVTTTTVGTFLYEGNTLAGVPMLAQDCIYADRSSVYGLFSL